MKTAPDEHPGDSPSRQRLHELHGELQKIETYLHGVKPLHNRDPMAILDIVMGEVIRLRQITGGYLSSNNR